ncbi:hypothetical protein HDE_06378 [Halotydeus destructor]|nr:hypothetical protein HDE_06378 [Halotydeus destructor]
MVVSKSMNIVDIETELLFTVFSFLPFSQVVKCERVCKKWHKLSVAYNASKQTCLFLISPFEVNSRPHNFCSDREHQIDENQCLVVRNAGFDMCNVLRKCPNLKALHMRSNENVIIREVDCEIIGMLCPLIEHLSIVDEISGIVIHGQTHRIICDLPVLRHVQLRFPASASTEDIWVENMVISQMLGMTAKRIEILSTNAPLDYENALYLADECSLTKLALHGTSMSTGNLETFVSEGNASGKLLTSLNIVIENDQQLDLVCTNMKCLTSLHCVIGYEEVESIARIGELTQLRTLFLSSWTGKAFDKKLLKVLAKSKQLRTLTVNAEVTDSSLSQIGALCPNLEHLEVELNSTASFITDKVIDSSLSELSSLKSLTFHFCDISDNGVKQLLANVSKQFRKLSINFSEKLTSKVNEICIEFAKTRSCDVISVKLPLITKPEKVIQLPKNLTINYVAREDE